MPDVEVKGESAAYFLLVQGSDSVEHEACRIRILHSDSQFNGAAAMATVSALLREKPPSSSGTLWKYLLVGIYSCFHTAELNFHRHK